MTTRPRASARDIAGDLTMAIHRGLLRPGERLPSQTKLMQSYGVAMGTASAAFGLLAAAGLVRSEPGRGTYVQDPDRVWRRTAVLDVMEASRMCRSMAATTIPEGTSPTYPVGGSPDWNDPHADPDKTWPPKVLDVSALAALDRHVLRWMSEAFLSAARRLVTEGENPADDHLIAAARALLRHGARRPEGQPGIAIWGGPVPADEDVALRIWPERARVPGPDESPF